MSRFSRVVSLFALLAFQHALADDPVPVSLGFDKGLFFRTQDGKYEIKLNSRIKSRFEFESDQNSAGRTSQSHFLIPEARLKVSGKLFTPKLTYILETDFGKGMPNLRDAVMDYAVVPGWFHIRAGQWFKPFARQIIISDSTYAFADRADLNNFFNINSSATNPSSSGRDLGFALCNNYEQSPVFEWALGLFNGTGEKPWASAADATAATFTNVPKKFRPQLVARAGYNYGGIKGYSESDIEGGGFRFAIAAATILDFDIDDKKTSAISGTLDLLLKVQGFSLFAAAFAGSKQDAGTDKFTSQSYNAAGGVIQAGYLIAGMVEPLLRFETTHFVNPTASKPDNNTHIAGAGINLFFAGHLLRWQLDFQAKIHDQPAGTFTDYVVRTQAQVGF